jgi:hypothetical protein
MTVQRYLFIVLFFIISCHVFSQHTDLADISVKYFQDQKSGMWILGTWGVGNMMVGGIGMSRANNPELKAFHQMNFGWGLVNSVIAGFGYYSAMNGHMGIDQPMDLLMDNQKLKSILLLNTGLDVAYMATGLYLMEKSKNSLENADRFKGFGKSLIMQGAFLFAFDLGMYFHFQSQDKNILKFFSSGEQIGMLISF